MYVIIVLVLILLVASAGGGGVSAQRPSCAQHEYNATQMVDAARLIQRAAQRSIVANQRMFNGKVFDARIDVRFTVLHDGDKGKVSREEIEKQLEVLQEGFNRRDADSGFTFTLQDVVYEDHSYWHGNCHKSNVANTLKMRFSKNVASTLNVIVCGPSSGILGFASFPSDAPEDRYEEDTDTDMMMTGYETKTYCTTGSVLVSFL